MALRRVQTPAVACHDASDNVSHTAAGTAQTQASTPSEDSVKSAWVKADVRVKKQECVQLHAAGMFIAPVGSSSEGSTAHAAAGKFAHSHKHICAERCRHTGASICTHVQPTIAPAGILRASHLSPDALRKSRTPPSSPNRRKGLPSKGMSASMGDIRATPLPLPRTPPRVARPVYRQNPNPAEFAPKAWHHPWGKEGATATATARNARALDGGPGLPLSAEAARDPDDDGCTTLLHSPLRLKQGSNYGSPRGTVESPTRSPIRLLSTVHIESAKTPAKSARQTQQQLDRTPTRASSGALQSAPTAVRRSLWRGSPKTLQ